MHFNHLVKKTAAFNCRWDDCQKEYPDLDILQSHISSAHLNLSQAALSIANACLWDTCLVKFSSCEELAFHLNDHVAYSLKVAFLLTL